MDSVCKKNYKIHIHVFCYKHNAYKKNMYWPFSGDEYLKFQGFLKIRHKMTLFMTSNDAIMSKNALNRLNNVKNGFLAEENL